MSTIRVDPDRLRKAANDIAAVAEELRAAGSQVHQAVQGAPGYDGQFGPQVASIGLEAHARSRALADRLAELSARLAAKAEAFEAVDAAALQGLASIRQELLAWVHSLGEFPLAPLLIPIDWGDDSPTLAEQLEALITRPPWLVARERPPWIPADVWARMNIAEREATLADAKVALERFWHFHKDHLTAGVLPDVLVVFAGGMNVRTEPNDQARVSGALGGNANSGRAAWNGQIRWDEEGQLWFHVSGGNTATGWVAAWQGGEADKINLVAFSLYEDGGPWTPRAETSGYGQEGGWDLYQTGSHPQFLNVRDIMRNAGAEGWQVYPEESHNLCGELAVFDAVGVPLERGFRAFAEIPKSGSSPGGSVVLADDGLTSSYHLQNTFSAFGWGARPGALSFTDAVARRELSGMFDAKEVPILNVTINAQGELVPRSSENGILHWVRLAGIHTAKEGTTQVEIYNPYTNSSEPYTLADLTGSSPQGTMVVGNPPDNNGGAP